MLTVICKEGPVVLSDAVVRTSPVLRNMVESCQVSDEALSLPRRVSADAVRLVDDILGGKSLGPDPRPRDLAEALFLADVLMLEDCVTYLSSAAVSLIEEACQAASVGKLTDEGLSEFLGPLLGSLLRADETDHRTA